LKTWGTQPFSAAKLRRTRITLATSTSWGQRSVQVKQAEQSHNVSLFSTRSLRPSCTMRIICLGRYVSLNLATGQSEVHVPHWKHFRSFSPPCIFVISYLNLGSISEAFIGSLVVGISAIVLHLMGSKSNAPCTYGYSQIHYQHIKLKPLFQ